MLNLGIIGVGGYGLTHVQGFLDLQAESLVRIAALADVSAHSLSEIHTQPGLKEARCFTDYRDLLALRDLDAVLICAPIPFHREITLAALERDLFILLEKPPVPLLSQLEELIKADRESRIMVAFQHIYSPLVREAKARILRGELGRLKAVSTRGIWPRPTSYYGRAGWAGQLEWKGRTVLDGPCTNAFAHYINLALHLCGGEDRSFASPTRILGEAYRARPQIASYDTGLLSGTLERNIAFAAGFTHAAAETNRVELKVTGTRESLIFFDDCEAVRQPDGSISHGGNGQTDMWRAFLAFAKGDVAQNRTPLQAAVPFVLATHLMFLSSGGIHPVPERFVRATGMGGQTIFAIHDLADLLARSIDQFTSLRQAGAEWAVASPPIEAAEFLEQEMVSFLKLTEERILSATP